MCTGPAGASRSIAAMTIVIEPTPSVPDAPRDLPADPKHGPPRRAGDAGAGAGAGVDVDVERHAWWRRPGRPAWSVPARAAIFAMTALLYTWNLARIGMGNDFYAAAVKSGTESWKAFFFGSLDPGSFITVDKPPAALWLMELSGRLFGFSSWSMLLPEALAGVATVMVLYHLVRRWFGEPAAVMASLALALTPVAVVIFRYNDPDAFLTLLLVLAAWGCWRAIETGKTIGLVLAGALVGLAFLTKTLDAFIVVPALALAYLWCGPPRLARRIGQLGWAALALLVSSGWWVAIVELWPKGARPYIGGSTDNSELNLIFGYNGFARIFGSGGAGAGGGTAAGTSSAFGGGEGLLRMFDSELGGQISWLLPVAVVGLVAGLWLTRHHARSDGRRAGFVLWGGTLLMFLAVYDYAKGIFHPYYTVVIAPAIAALAGAGAVALWRLGRQSLRWAWVLPATIVGTVLWADALLARTSGYDAWLGPTVVVTGVLSALILLLCMVRPKGTRWFALFAGTVAAVSVLAGPAAYSLTTLGTTTSAIATAGPASASGGIGAGGGPGGGSMPGGSGAGGPPSTARTGARAGIGSTAAFAGGRVSGGGGAASTVDQSLVQYLERHQGSATYLVAVNGSQSAAPFILESGKAVIAMGGFGGSDPAPTLSEFKHLVATGKVHYVYVSGGTGSASGAGGSGFGAGGGGTPPEGLGTTASTTGSATRTGGSAGQGGRPGASGGGQQTSTASAVDAWVEKYGTKVSSSAYGGSSAGGTLYYVSSSAAST
jgi:4-amino-4-deoxy-L-arabinose transferase-like glycosyltransferase